MQSNALKHMPVIDLKDTAALAAIFPSEFVGNLLLAADDATRALMPGIAPGDDPAPIVMLLGWNEKQPTVDVVSIDGRFLQDGSTKQKLAAMLRNFVLDRRAKGQETYAAALINAAWHAHLPIGTKTEGGIHRVETEIERIENQGGLKDEPGRIEVMLVDVIWQDGQRTLVCEIHRGLDGKPSLGESWHDASSGMAVPRNRFWTAIAPALASMAYADAMLAVLEQPEASSDDLSGGSAL